MTHRLPTYCPLALRFDARRLRSELARLRKRFASLATTQEMIDRRSSWFAVADEARHRDVERIEVDRRGGRSLIRGRVASWRGMGLTHVPDHPETAFGSSRYRRRFDGRWRWKDELDLPYTRKLVRRIGFDRIDNVRVMSLPARGFGPVHVDWENEDPWEKDGLVSITFLASDGGVPMRFLTADGRLHDASHAVFFFKDCAPHGVPVTRKARLLLRVNGTMAKRRLASLMRIKEAVW